MSENLEKYFDDYFEKKPPMEYEFDRAKMGWKDRRIVRTLTEYGINGKVCLDIGPGTGRWVQFLRQQGARRIEAADISPVSLKRCAPYCDKVHQLDIQKEKFACPAESFDVVVFIEIIEHLVDSGNCIAEIMRVLRPGGLLLLSTPNLVSFISRVRMVLGQLPVAIASDMTHVRFFRRQELSRLFENFPVRLTFLSTSFSLHPLKPKSRIRCRSFGWMSRLDDSLLLKVEKTG